MAKILNVFGEGVIIDWVVRNCLVKFLFGNTTLKDEPRTKRPSDIDDDILKTISDQNLCQSRSELAKWA